MDIPVFKWGFLILDTLKQSIILLHTIIIILEWSFKRQNVPAIWNFPNEDVQA